MPQADRTPSGQIAPQKCEQPLTEYVAPTRIQNVAASWEDFDKLPLDVQTEAWAQLRIEAARRVDGIAHHEGSIYLPVVAAPRPKRAWKPRRVNDPSAALDTLETSDYVHALTGTEVAPRKPACCPLPGHDDDSPSFSVTRSDPTHFYCYGCNRGGSIFDFAAHLWEIPGSLRGDRFREVRDRLLDELGIRRE